MNIGFNTWSDFDNNNSSFDSKNLIGRPQFNLCQKWILKCLICPSLVPTIHTLRYFGTDLAYIINTALPLSKTLDLKWQKHSLCFDDSGDADNLMNFCILEWNGTIYLGSKTTRRLFFSCSIFLSSLPPQGGLTVSGCCVCVDLAHSNQRLVLCRRLSCKADTG